MPRQPTEPEETKPPKGANAPPAEPPEETKPARSTPAKKDQLQAILWNPPRNLSVQVDRSAVIHFKPGWNFVAVFLWEKAAKLDMVQIFIRTKIPQARSPEEMSTKIGQPYLVVGKVLDRDNPLRQLTMDEALLFIQETLVIATLKVLLEQEQRPELLRAIRSQIDSIEKPRESERRAREKAEASEAG